MIRLQRTDKLQYNLLHFLKIHSGRCYKVEMIMKLTLLVSVLKFRKIYQSVLKYHYWIPLLVYIFYYSQLATV